MKNLSLNTDFVVCLALETTQPAQAVNYRRAFCDDRLSLLSKGKFEDSAKTLDCSNLQGFASEQGQNLPRTLHLDWTICSVKEFKVLDVASIYVNQDQPVDEATASFTGVNQECVSKEGVSFQAALEKFTSSVQAQTQGKSCAVVTPSDWECKYQLPLDCAKTGVQLPDLLKAHSNILELHYELLPEKQALELSDILRHHELDAIQGPTKAKKNSQSLVRVVNRMIRFFKTQLENEKSAAVAPTAAAAWPSHNSNESTEDSKMVEDSNSVRRRSRSHSSEKQNNDTKKPVEFADSDQVALRLRGIPFQGQVSDVITFFQKWNLEEDRVQMIEKDDGRFSGVALVLFNSPAEAEEAMNEMQGQNIGHRWIEIFPLTYEQYKNKNSGGGGGGNRGSREPMEDVLISKFLNPGNVTRAVKLGGLPFRVKNEEVIEFFKDFNIAESDIVIEQQDGRRTGYGIVFLKDEEAVEEAISTLHRQYIGPRFVNVWQAELRRGGSRQQANDDY